MFENVYGRMHRRTDGRMPDRPVYYKLTLSGELQTLKMNEKLRKNQGGVYKNYLILCCELP